MGGWTFEPWEGTFYPDKLAKKKQLEYASRQFPPSQDPGRAAEARLRHIEWLQDAFNAVEAARPPVIAAIHGGCVGAGVDLASACDLRVEGQVEGNVSISGEFLLEEGASIQGDVEAVTVTINGALTGDVSARGAVTIRATAKVTGNFGAPEVSIDEGAEFSGHIEADFELPAELTAARQSGR